MSKVIESDLSLIFQALLCNFHRNYALNNVGLSREVVLIVENLTKLRDLFLEKIFSAFTENQNKLKRLLDSIDDVGDLVRRVNYILAIEKFTS